jgi:cell division protein FtsB
MRELQEKQKIKQRLYSTPVVVALLLLTVVLVRGAYAVVMKDRESIAGMDTLQAKVVDLSNKEFELKSQIASLNTEAGIDEAIKEKFNVAAPGEHVAFIVDPAAASTTSTTTPQVWYKRMWDAIISAL